MVQASWTSPWGDVSGTSTREETPGGDPGADRGHAGGIISLGWLGNVSITLGGVGGSWQ